MADAEPTLAELIERAQRSDRSDIHVSMPGIVVSYDASTKTAEIRPALRRVIADEDDELQAEEIPPLKNVPVCFPGSSKLTVHFNLEPGDTGDLIFSSWSHNEWRGSGQVSTPGDLKTQGLGSAKFYPGLRHKTNAPPETDESIGVPGGLRIKFGSSIDVGTGAQSVVIVNLLTALLDTILTAGVGEGGAGAANFTAAKAALTSYGAPIGSSKLKADP